jgi:RNA polymerase sigma factor (sigma-70 family)
MIMIDDGDTGDSGRSDGDRRTYLAGLLKAAREGDSGAVGGLVSELSPLLWQVARATGLGTVDTEDVVQTVWMSLLSHLDTIREPSALTSWLIITTRREAWRVRAAGKRQQPADQDWLLAIPDQVTGAEERLIAEQERRDLLSAYLSLSQRCQELLRIVAFVQRPDYDVVASQLGMPRGSVGPTRSRCLEKLRIALPAEPQERGR